jgi:REP element-mobilizing transposase RayT
MDQAPYNLDQTRRDAVWEAIQEVYGQRGWSLLAAHVRSSHVHTLVQSPGSAGADHERLQSLRQPVSESDET